MALLIFFGGIGKLPERSAALSVAEVSKGGAITHYPLPITLLPAQSAIIAFRTD